MQTLYRVKTNGKYCYKTQKEIKNDILKSIEKDNSDKKTTDEELDIYTKIMMYLLSDRDN